MVMSARIFLLMLFYLKLLSLFLNFSLILLSLFLRFSRYSLSLLLVGAFGDDSCSRPSFLFGTENITDLSLFFFDIDFGATRLRICQV